MTTQPLNYLRQASEELRRVWIAQIEKEIAGERVFVANQDEMTDDELWWLVSHSLRFGRSRR